MVEQDRRVGGPDVQQVERDLVGSLQAHRPEHLAEADQRVPVEVGDADRLVGDHQRPLAQRILGGDAGRAAVRSEEHTSELQSLMRISYAVFCLKKKNQTTTSKYPHHTVKRE